MKKRMFIALAVIVVGASAYLAYGTKQLCCQNPPPCPPCYVE